MPKWTREQKQAIESRGENLLLSAAAGSGKTAVLVERIIQMITEDELDIDRLLIVTFTKAAAGEMRERIGNAVVKALEEKTGNPNHLRRQMTLLNRAKITTLHSFCIDVIQKNFHLIHLDPSFRIGDQTENSLLSNEALGEVFEEHYEKQHPIFHQLVESFGGSKEDDPLKDMVLKAYRFTQSQPEPMEWLEKQMEHFHLDKEADLENHPWTLELKKGIERRLKGAKDLFQRALEVAESPGGPEAYIAALEEDLRMTEELEAQLDKSLNGFYQVLKELKHPRLKKVNKEVCDPALKEEGKALRDDGKDMIGKIKKDQLQQSPSRYFKDLQRIAPLMDYFYGLVRAYDQRYGEKKREQGLMDFNDLEHFALEILKDPKAQQMYREQFEYIFIDEYQDSNIVQETLIQRICREDNLFMVGDVKQSIYRFRLGDPTLFLEKYETFDKKQEGEDRSLLNRRIDLSKNFRSRSSVIDGVNFLFRHLMSKDLGEIHYDESAYLYRGREHHPIEDSDLELHLIEKKEEDLEGVEEELQELKALEFEARVVVKRIKELTGDMEIYDEKLQALRRVTYRDMVILLRSTKNSTDIFQEELAREGIPAYADSHSGYFEALEVQMFLDLLRVVDNKAQDIPLISVMRSPMGGFTTEELIKIRLENKQGSYYEALKNAGIHRQDALGKKAGSFLENLKKWKEDARLYKIDEFIWKLLRETGYYYFLGAMPGGKQRQANLRILLDRASEFQQTSIKGLFQFIEFMEKIKQGSDDFGAAKILGEKENVVRLMSIHKSKGLEFPVVFLAGLGKQFNKMDIRSPMLMHKDLGLGPKFVDLQTRTYRDTLGKVAMKEVIEGENLSEEMRILYVAMTRAEDKLVLSASVPGIEKQLEKWEQSQGSYALRSAKSPMDWIGPLLMKHQGVSTLREAGGFEPSREELIKDESPWRIDLVDRKGFSQNLVEIRDKEEQDRQRFKELENRKEEAFSPYRETIHQRLDWVYPYKGSESIPSKLTVTDLKAFDRESMERVKYKVPSLKEGPRFLEEQRAFEGKELGTILHFFMQHLDFHQAEDLSALEKQREEMVRRDLLREEEAEALELEKVQRFLQSPLGRRMKKAKKIHREEPFNIWKKAGDLSKELAGCEDKVLIQGMIDCYFEEAGQWVLVDYKSDYLWEGNRREKIETYRPQLRLYREALESITGTGVKETIIHFFYTGESIEI
ncbi:helicase-exonuclease AddAB subunit AddA [Isachenkonia alkalipeptolytica]|uniref:ATP-dependent helicase/nuclease subunit A n=1 Tax=Isachenkonia alkalipeptolytica TaxID=2565777 RepID=A0AA44BDR5_9CLOT|nr:helicase-exonuclease AddAB subunit AddA [Isachenkonia alkalipeptolytica]NBG87360.1 helicase-exonuclease AddAB subunit AddA [Isachenkonia alkalipeptolytica]